ncbi:MAG TPA: hypothetical protein VHM88_25420, partial [Candidatus Acidoferrales bacterium]|nr:hypothetical protein [Candidatus Acidoferrales bacterium]
HGPLTADYRNLEHGLIYAMNPGKGPDAQTSQELDFTGADRADAAELNRILWRNRKGSAPMPSIQHQVLPARGQE